MRLSFLIRLTLAGLAATVVLLAQPAPPRVFGPPDRPEVAPKPVVPNPAQPQTPAQQGAHPQDSRRNNRPRSNLQDNQEPSPPPSRNPLPLRKRRDSPTAGPSSCPTRP